MTGAGERLTAAKAVGRGLWTVNGSVMLLMFGPAAAAFGLGALLGHPNVGGVAGLVLVPVGFLAAWAFWSVNVPRWRLWAYRRVEDLNELKAQAVASGLIWPDGHFFEKTEYRPKWLRDELAALERRSR